MFLFVYQLYLYWLVYCLCQEYGVGVDVVGVVVFVVVGGFYVNYFDVFGFVLQQFGQVVVQVVWVLCVGLDVSVLCIDFGEGVGRVDGGV